MVGSSQGLATFNGQTVPLLVPTPVSPVASPWNFDIQHSLTPNLILEVAYIGNHSLRLPVLCTHSDVIVLVLEDAARFAHQNLIMNLTAHLVPNPLVEMVVPLENEPQQLDHHGRATARRLSRVSRGTGSGSTGVVEQNNTIGSSVFESLNVRLQRGASPADSRFGNYIHIFLVDISSGDSC